MFSSMTRGSHVLIPETKPLVDVDTVASISPEYLEDSFVYVHCEFQSLSPGMLIRIWKTTFLNDCDSASKSQLVHAENISMAPQWTMVPDGGFYNFLLIFSALPKWCTRFDLAEEIPQAGGFLVRNIQRNKSDVYRITLQE